MKCIVIFTLAVGVMQAQRTVVAIAHRGEHLHHGENTIPAFEEAIRVGADFFEVDVRTSADGKLVLSHDATVDRCTNGKGRVEAMSFEQLLALDAGGGAKIPLFEEALALASGKIGVYVDIKAASAKDLVRQIEAHGMVESVVMYCSPNFCKQLLDLNSKLKVMPEAGSVARATSIVELLHPKVIAFDAGDFRPEIIAVSKNAGAAVYVDRMGKTDAPEGWQAAIDAGADGIQTDRPAELVKYLQSKGYRR